jgi:hypothetical protein
MLQFDYNEGWNAFRQQAAAQGQALYAAPPGLDITNYPPVSFHLVGLLSHLGGDVNTIGRVLSVLAVAALAALAGALVRRFAPQRPAARAVLLYSKCSHHRLA